MPLINKAAPATESSGSGEEVEELGEEIEELGEDIEELGEEVEELDEEVVELSSDAEIFEEDLVEPEELEELSDSEELDQQATITTTVSSASAIVESSDPAMVDALLDTGTSSKAGDLEELEEPDELEELDELEPDSSAQPASAPVFAADVASKIEFGSSDTAENIPEPEDEKEFVIVSPFSSMLSKFDDQGSFKADEEESKDIKTSGRLEELNADYSMSLVYKPFQNEDKTEPPELPAVGPGVIMQKNGINYVDKKAKKPDSKTSKSLDPGLKNLVDSVIGKK
jgi:hypothetical protein